MSSGNSSSFSMPQNQEKKQIPRYEVRFTNKNHPFMWLVCKTRAKILLSDPETSLTTPRLLPLRRSRRSYGNYQNRPSRSDRLEIFETTGAIGTIRTVIWKPGFTFSRFAFLRYQHTRFVLLYPIELQHAGNSNHAKTS